jgi:hypothetical protein
MPGIRRRQARCADLGRKSSGTPGAFEPDVRRLASVIRFVACVLVTAALTASPVVSGLEADHLACLAAHHGCGSASIASSCCCGGQTQTGSSRQASGRYRSAPAETSCPTGGPTTAIVPSDAGRAIVRPLPLVPADIPILVANLRL